PLLDDSLAVAVEWDAGRVVTARVLEEARFDFEHVVFAVAVGIKPLADRIARVGRLGLFRPRPALGGAPPAPIVVVVDQDVGGVRSDDDLRRRVEAHHRWHALVNAEGRGPVAGTAGFEVGFDRLPDLLIFGRERRRTAEPDPIVWVGVKRA